MTHDRQEIAPSLPPWTVRLPEDASAPRVARDALDEWLRDADQEARRDARSVVSELVANAVRQGSPRRSSCRSSSAPGRARIEVADAGVRDGRRPPEGWSQRIIAGLAARWGVRGDDAHVWFELPVREPGDGEGRLG